MASTDRGISYRALSVESKRSPAFNVYTQSLLTLDRSTYASSTEPLTSIGPVFNGEDLGATYSTSPVGGRGGLTSITYYKMQGWYVAGSAYETWVAVNAPNSTPPSGHTLTDITVVGIIRRSQ